MSYINDPILQLWEDNYNNNIKSGIFDSTKSKTLSLLSKNINYNNLPILIVAAGKSIDFNIEYIKQHKNNFIIICVDIVLFKLLENDIVPDFVINIDPHEFVYSFFYDLDTSTTTLVCPTTVHGDALNYWNGDFVFFNQSDSNPVKGNHLKNLTTKTQGFGNIENKFFVGATAYLFAKLLKPSSICFVGYDFVFINDEPYCSGVLERKAKFINFRDNTSIDETILYNQLKDKELGDSVVIQNIRTKSNLRLYFSTFVDLLKSDRIVKISLSDKNLYKIDNVDSFDDYIKHYANTPLNKAELKIRKKRRKKA